MDPTTTQNEMPLGPSERRGSSSITHDKQTHFGEDLPLNVLKGRCRTYEYPIVFTLVDSDSEGDYFISDGYFYRMWYGLVWRDGKGLVGGGEGKGDLIVREVGRASAARSTVGPANAQGRSGRQGRPPKCFYEAIMVPTAASCIADNGLGE